MDVSDGRVVHKKSQAGLEVASNHCESERGGNNAPKLSHIAHLKWDTLPV